jgi:hypothetical protein
MFDEAIKKIADDINKKRRQELITHFLTWDSPVKQYVLEAKKQGIYDKGSKSKVWRKIASMPYEVDQFFTRVYGPDYYKDKHFFDKFPEWKVIDDGKDKGFGA